MPEAGWYQDPHNPNQQRYWDGSTWTEHTHDAPFEAPQAPGPNYDAGYVNDIGDWLSRSFRVLFANAMPLFLLLLLGLIPAIVTFSLFANAFEGVSVSLDDGTFSGLSASGLSLAIIGSLVAAVIGVAFGLAQSHLLHRGHLALATSVGDSLGAGFRGTLRYIGWAIVIGLVFVAAIVAGAILVAVIAAVSAGLATLVGLVAFLVLLVGLVWLWVKASFLGVSAAVAPGSESALRASFERSVGRFWPVFGRLLLLAVIIWIVGAIISSFASPSYFSAISVDAGGDLVLNGVPVDELDEIVLSDLLPFRNELLVATIISSLLNGAIGMFSRSGVASLYADLNGPSQHQAEDSVAPAPS